MCGISDPVGLRQCVGSRFFYSSWADTEPLKGDILGPQEGAHGSHSYFNVFDGHTDTSYDHPFDYGGWAGLDLGERKR